MPEARPLSRRIFCAGCAAAAACAPGETVFFGADSGDTGAADDPEETTLREQVCAQPMPTGSSRVALPLSDYPALATAGGSVAIASPEGEVVVARVAADCVVAVLRACTHEGVAIDYVASREQFVCPRHGAVYDWDGSKVSGPQPRGLPTWPADIDGDTIYVHFDAGR